MLSPYLEQHKSRIVGLDILRTLAIVQVVYGHGVRLLPETAKPVYWQFMFKMDGVSIFFVLSGFLIGGILLRTINTSQLSARDLVDFWVRRWFRTIPNYLLVVVALLAFDLLTTHSMGAFSWKYLFFLQNLNTPHPAFFPEAWSLCIEEWFYLTFPLLCFALYRVINDRKKTVLYAALLFIVAPVIIRIFRFEESGMAHFDAMLRKIVVCRLDSLMYGIIGAYIFTTNSAWWQRVRYWSLAAGIVAFTLITWNPHRWPEALAPYYFSIESVVVLLFLPFFSGLKTTKLRLLDAGFIFISIISYSMYLLNLTPVQEKMLPLIDKALGIEGQPVTTTMWYNYPLFWFLTIFCSWLLYITYEKRMTNLRDKFPVGKNNNRTSHPQAPTQ